MIRNSHVRHWVHGAGLAAFLGTIVYWLVTLMAATCEPAERLGACMPGAAKSWGAGVALVVFGISGAWDIINSWNDDTENE